MPRSTARCLHLAGHEARDVREIGLRGKTDAEVFKAAQDLRAILVTADLGFANTLTFPLGSHYGIVVVRFPNDASVEKLNRGVVSALSGLTDEEVHGCLIILEPGRMRLRKPSTS
ncbi:MAG TPA: DUF5615 family PIN-like protein [Clostridia bacterium]|nr:DUF5615 family PIN-like protein [Clostridia bacterium]